MFRSIVRHRKAVLVLFAVLTVICLFCRQLVSVNYDLNDYLPEESNSTVSIDMLEDEFDSSVPNARVMVSDVTLSEALAYKDALLAIDGVTDVTWLDDAVDISSPLEMQDQDVVEDYYLDDNALFSVTIDDDKRVDAVYAIEDLVGDAGALTGTAVSVAHSTTDMLQEIAIVAVFAVIIVLIILALTTTSWLMPLLILLGLGVAILINMGTNLMFGEVSYITNAAAAVLQLAISLDFSVFLLHRYMECRHTTESVAEDMVQAMCKSSTAILSSACAVMAGFLALCAMRFLIGPDLGLVLAKGILISLICTFTFTPCLIVACERGIVASEHHSFMPSFKHFGGFVGRVSIPLALVFLLLPVPAYLASTSSDTEYYYGSTHMFNEGTTVGDDTKLINDTFGESDTYVLMVPCGDAGQEVALAESLQQIPQVSSIISYTETVGAAIPAEMLATSDLEELQSDNYRRLVLSVDVGNEGDETFDLVAQIRAIAEDAYPGAWYLAGEGVSTTDMMSTIVEDKETVDLISIVAIIVVLLIATQSIVTPFILLLVIQTCIWVNFALPYFTGEPIFYMVYLIVSSIQLGVTVDYAILISDRYKEARQTLPKYEAVRAVMMNSTVAVSTSALALMAAGFLLYEFSSNAVLSQIGFYLAVGALMSLAAVLLVLPGYLLLFDRLIGWTTHNSHFVPNPPREKRGKRAGEVPAPAAAATASAVSAEPAAPSPHDMTVKVCPVAGETVVNAPDGSIIRVIVQGDE